MKNICSLLIILATLSITAQAGNRKEQRDGERMARYITAVQALKAKNFGFMASSYKNRPASPVEMSIDEYTYMGFDGEILILQGRVFSGNDFRNRCSVKNYEVNVDEDGNLEVKFDFKGRVTAGKVLIKMKAGNNYAVASISRGERAFYYDKASNKYTKVSETIVSGKILQSDKCDYKVIASEL